MDWFILGWLALLTVVHVWAGLRWRRVWVQNITLQEQLGYLSEVVKGLDDQVRELRVQRGTMHARIDGLAEAVTKMRDGKEKSDG